MNVVQILLRLTFLNSDGDHYASYIDGITGGESLLTSMLECDGSGLFRKVRSQSRNGTFFTPTQK